MKKLTENEARNINGGIMTHRIPRSAHSAMGTFENYVHAVRLAIRNCIVISRPAGLLLARPF